MLLQVKNIKANEREGTRSCFDPYSETRFGEITFVIKGRKFRVPTYDRCTDFLLVDGEKIRLYGVERLEVIEFIRKIWDERNVVLIEVPECICNCI